MTREWTTPGASPMEFSLKDAMGQLVIVAVGGFEPLITTAFGERDAVRVACIELTGERAGEVHPNLLVFNSRIVNRLRYSPGQIVLGAVMEVQSRGANPALDLIDPGPEAGPIADAFEEKFPGRLDQILADVVNTHASEVQKRANPQQRPMPQPIRTWSPQHQSPATTTSSWTTNGGNVAPAPAEETGF